MPAIKLKKVTAQYIAEKERQSSEKEKEKKKNLEDLAEENNKKEESNETEDKKETKPYNFLDVELLWDKRKRSIPASEQKVQEWLASNLEKREDVTLSLLALYDYYAQTCQLEGTNVVDTPIFNRYVREQFGACFGFKEASPYKGLIKEKKKKEKKPRVQGETFSLKFKDIIQDVISTAGNPRRGLRFGTLKTAVSVKYPALRVDLHPKKLKNALEKGIRFGQVELVKGVGMCGFYRLPGPPDREEEPEKKSKKTSKSTEESVDSEEKSATNGTEEKGDNSESSADGESKDEDKDEKVEDEKVDEDEEDGEKKATTTSTRRGRRSKVNTEEKEEKQTKKTETSKSTGKKKTKKLRKKKKPEPKVYRSPNERHCHPERVDEVFPMAMTYQSDPKEASMSKIKAYVSKHYKEENPAKLKKCLDSGIEKGLWTQNKGSYQLEIDTFNPSHSKTLEDRICQAIVACHEPKQASALLLKKYISEYHPNLNIDAKPYLFKHALERACQKGILKQLSGIGASGSFQLVEKFYPSPALLAGEVEDEYESEEDEAEDILEEVYIPRVTKRGRSSGRQPKQEPAKKKRR